MVKSLELIQAYRQRMTGEIPRPVARLYSAHIRLTWESQEIPGTIQRDREIIQDAVKLIQAASFEKEHDVEAEHWQDSLRRAAEILEWLSHPQMDLSAIPTRLLAAAAYQLAGYPARAASLISSAEEGDSPILRAFLQSDFQTLFRALASHWAEYPADKVEYGQVELTDPDAFSRHLSDLVISSILSAMGVIAAQMRWGDETRTQKAIEKLQATAKLLLHCDDFYSWLLGELCAQVADTYIATSLRWATQDLEFSESGRKVLERYLRQAYRQNKTLAWPSQLRGIERLRQKGSFALCTPTGSGKTTVAELAILQGLFSNSANSSKSPLVLYLVPSRALATEVEAKLSGVFKVLHSKEVPEEIIVTGLYGGADWGPTDAWVLRKDPTVLICTYEKAEALMRYLGATLTERLSMVILDEAHRVQFDGNEQKLAEADDRSLRLETLAMRLFPLVERHHGRIIALSAVAQEMETALASWVANAPGSEPVKSGYHSTRQLLGRLECRDRGFTIHYDLLDSKRLHLDDSDPKRVPFVPQPFPPYPSAPPDWEPKPPAKTEQPSSSGMSPARPRKSQGPSQKYVYPYLFWAAIQLAQHRSVLIAVPQRLDRYAKNLLIALDLWQKDCPSFFALPEGERETLWRNCLAACEDYLGRESNEYKLLEKGVVVHHGKMPAPLARLLVDLISERVVRLVIATSTLSEGVNLPFETILLAELRRYDESEGKLRPMHPSDIANLVGRAGRPGHATEGQTLVLTFGSDNRSYNNLIGAFEARSETKPNAALQRLLELLYRKWQELRPSGGFSEFLTWLEEVTPRDVPFSHLDTVDDIVLTAIVDLENASDGVIKSEELEDQLKVVWRRSYAYFAGQQEDRWEEAFIRRGRAIVTHEGENYGDRKQRRQLYATTLPPRAATQLLNLYSEIEGILKTGADYAAWDNEQRFQYIVEVARRICQVSKFQFSTKTPKDQSWETVLHWWLDPFWGVNEDGSSRDGFIPPQPDRTFKWYEYVNTNFIYKLNWGIGACISTAFSRAYDDGERRIPNIENWLDSGLPWVVFWLKELITWGTLDPVAAYLLARARNQGIITRSQAQSRAYRYYEEHRNLSADEQLNPETIQQWVAGLLRGAQPPHSTMPPTISATLLRDFSNSPISEFRVLPANKEGKILWFDSAGFLLAESNCLDRWDETWIDNFDFFLEWRSQLVRISSYL